MSTPSPVEALLQRIDSMTAPGPVTWFLDIDGVINLVRARGGDWPTYAQAYVEDTRNGTQRFFVWSPDLVTVLNAIVARGLVTVRWLTTWEYEAVTNVAPALGLRVGAWVAGIDTGDEKLWWKLRVIKEYMADEGHFFVWTDDHIDKYAIAMLVTPRHGILINPPMEHGLTPAHITTILDAIEKYWH